MNVLIVEDDAENAAFIAKGLQALGYGFDWAESGTNGLALAMNSRYDVIVLDRMLPQIDGIRLVRKIRAAGNATPVLFLTHLSGIDDRVEGLEAGGDDYLIKPFALTELMARLSALARRNSTTSEPTFLAVGGLEMDLIRRTVRREGAALSLNPREFQLLEYFMRNQGRILTRRMLLEKVWNFHFDPTTNLVETHVSRLRSKIDKGRAVALLHTLRGVGYSLRAPQ